MDDDAREQGRKPPAHERRELRDEASRDEPPVSGSPISGQDVFAAGLLTRLRRLRSRLGRGSKEQR